MAYIDPATVDSPKKIGVLSKCYTMPKRWAGVSPKVNGKVNQLSACDGMAVARPKVWAILNREAIQHGLLCHRLFMTRFAKSD